MGWAEQKAREIAGHWSSDDFGGDATDPLVLRAIRETIEKCAEVADESLSEVEAAIAIRKLGEP